MLQVTRQTTLHQCHRIPHSICCNGAVYEQRVIPSDDSTHIMKKQGVLHIVLGLVLLLRWPNDRLLFGAQLRTYTQTTARTNLNGLQRLWLHQWERQLDSVALPNPFNAQHITHSYYKALTPEVFPSSL